MTEQASPLNSLFAFDPHALEAPGSDSRFIIKIPGPDRPLICKILPDPGYANGKSWYRPHKQFSHLVGPNRDTDTRQHVCQSFFGLSSPENDAFWEYKKALGELKKQGKGNSVEAAKLEALCGEKGIFKPKNGGWLLIIEPESPIIKAVRVPVSVIDLMNGKDKTEYKPAIPSLIKQMAAGGVSPFDIVQQKPKQGWIKLYRTGEKMATRYFVEAAEVNLTVEKDGRKFSATDYQEFNVHSKILSGELTRADLPDVVVFERKFAFTPEEALAYVKSQGTAVPSRLLKVSSSKEGRTDETDESSPSGQATVASLADLPPMNLGLAQTGVEVKAVTNLDEIPF